MSNSITINGIPVGTVGTPSPAPCPTNASLCDLTTPAECVVYIGGTLPYIGVVNNDNLKEALRKIDLTLLSFTADGIPGPIGLTGPAGPTGAAGPAGPQGPIGPTGPIGITGPAGAQGVKGDTGLQGPQGLTGPQGTTGPQGVPGPMGVEGPAGPKGDIGPMGLPGPQGIRGLQGLKGDTGSVGPAGAQGPAGPTGADGAAALWNYKGAWSGSATYVAGDIVTYQGSSYYTLSGSVGNNIPGTIGVDWAIIATKGSTGATGATGDTGATGPQGEQGIQGIQGIQGNHALWFFQGAWINSVAYVAGSLVTYNGSLYYSFTGTSIGQAPGDSGADWQLAATKGDQGPQGIQGVQGDQGIQGIQGPAGTNGTSVTILGTVSSIGSLPSTGNTNGDSYILSTNGHLYVWSGSVWTDVGQIQGPAGSTLLSGLTDVTLTSLANGQLLRYNSTTGKWENFTPSYLTANQSISVQGDINTFTGTTSLDIVLKNLSVAGTYNNVTINAKGLVTTGSNVSYLTSASLATLTDVQLSSLASNQLLRYNTGLSKWENFTPTYISANQTITASGDVVTATGTTSLSLVLNSIATAGTYNTVTIDAKGRVLSGATISYLTSAALSTLTDVTLTSLQNNQLLKYDTGTSKWINFTPTYISGNQSITISGDASGSGTTSISLALAVVNGNVGTFGSASSIPVITVNAKGLVTAVSTQAVNIVTSLSGLSDVTITAAADAQLLRYNSATSKWINWTPTYISANQTITFTASGDVTGTTTGTTALSPSITVTGLLTKALPALATGLLKYNGVAWTFDNTAYLTSYTETDPVFVAWRDASRNYGYVYVGPVAGGTPTWRALTVAEITGAAPLASPTFTGIPAAPTATAGTNTTQLATTAFVQAALTAAGSITNLDSLTDVVITTAAIGNLLRYDGTNWVNWVPTYISGNQSITLSGDVSGSGTTSIVTTLATVNTSVGTYGNTTTIPVITVNAKGLVTGVTTATVSTGSQTLAGLTDVTITTPANLQILQYNSTTSKWNNVNSPYLTANQSITVTGDITGSGTTSLTLSLNTVNSNIGTFNNVTVNAKGLVTAASNVAYLTSFTETDPVFVSWRDASRTAGFVYVANTAAASTPTWRKLILNDITTVATTTLTSGQLFRYDGTNWANWTPTYISANQSITFTASGDVSGTSTGTVSLTPTLTLASIVTAVGTNTFLKFAYDVKGRVTGSTAVVTADITTALGYTPENVANKGVANGYAGLGSDGKVPSTQLPSYVDDVVEYLNVGSFPGVGESGKIYVDLATNKIYRWSGTVYIEISASPGSTDAVPEGATNKYFTAARALAAVPNATTSVYGLIKVGANLSINGTTGALDANFTAYSLPSASASVLGGIKVGSGLSIDGTGILSTTYSYSLPTASTSVLGGVKVDGTTITINGSGVISGANTYSLPIATGAVLGGVKIGSGVSIDGTGVISVSTNYQAPLTGGTGLLVLTGSTITYLGTGTYYSASNPNGYTSNTGTVTNIIFNSGNGTTTSGGPISTTGTITIGSTGDNIRINSLGVGVAASATTGRIDAAGDIVGFSSSDIRLKKDVSILENATEALSKLRGVSYVWDPQSFDVHGYTGKDYGIIAQDVEKVFPEMIQHRDNGYMAVRYERLIGVLVAAINEQNKRIEDLEKRAV